MMTQQTNLAPNGVGMKEVWNRFGHTTCHQSLQPNLWGCGWGNDVENRGILVSHESLTTWFVQDPLYSRTSCGY
jgi:hypothetical protein